MQNIKSPFIIETIDLLSYLVIILPALLLNKRSSIHIAMSTNGRKTYLLDGEPIVFSI